MKKKYFGTDGIRGRVGSAVMDAPFALKLGWAAGKVLARHGTKEVLIGKDTRVSGYVFESALEAGLISAGVNVTLLGPLPTPGVAYLTRAFRAAAGIVISASHNPYYDNGIKFFDSKGYKLSDKVQHSIETMIAKPFETVDALTVAKASRLDDAVGRYVEFCKSTFPKGRDLSKFKIVVDAAHGAAYDVAWRVFSELGADVVSIGAEPDGYNINESHGSTAPQTMCKRVRKERADLGIALDGDADRVVMCDKNGKKLSGDALLLILADAYKQRGTFSGGVVGTTISSLGLEEGLRELEIPFVRSNVGDRFVTEDMRKRKWLLGGEECGHIVCGAHNTTGDGIVTALQVLSVMEEANKPLHTLAETFKVFPRAVKNVQVKHILDALPSSKILNKAVADARDALGDTGYVNVRPSGTEPIVRVTVEGSSKVQVQKVCKSLAAVVKKLRL